MADVPVMSPKLSFDCQTNLHLVRRSLHVPSAVLRATEAKRFVCYLVYAWGYPLLMTVLIIFMDVNAWIPEHLRPNIGTSSCWFESKLKRMEET